MKPPREAAGLGQAGELAQSLAELGTGEAVQFFLSLKTPLKPLEPIFYSVQGKETPPSTAKRVDMRAGGLSRTATPYNPPITSGSTPTHSGTLEGNRQKAAPSAPRPLTLPPLSRSSSPEVIGGCPSTPTLTPFTPAPGVEYRDLCEYHASLSAYIEREAGELRASGQGDALAELETLAGKMLDRMGELEAQGAHRTGSAGGSL